MYVRRGYEVIGFKQSWSFMALGEMTIVKRVLQEWWSRPAGPHGMRRQCSANMQWPSRTQRANQNISWYSHIVSPLETKNKYYTRCIRAANTMLRRMGIYLFTAVVGRRLHDLWMIALFTHPNSPCLLFFSFFFFILRLFGYALQIYIAGSKWNANLLIDAQIFDLWGENETLTVHSTPIIFICLFLRPILKCIVCTGLKYHAWIHNDSVNHNTRIF